MSRPPALAGRSRPHLAGMLGNAAAPPSLLFLQSLVGWRGAFLGAAVLGLVAALVMAVAGDPPELEAAPGKLNACGGTQADATQSGAVPMAGAFCSRPRSCSISHSSSCWRCRVARSTISRPRARRASRHAGHGRQRGSDRPAAAEPHRGAGRRLARRTHPASRLGRHLRPDRDGGGHLAGRVVRFRRRRAGHPDVDRGLLLRPHHAVARHDRARRHPPGAYGRVFGFVSTGFNIGGIVSPLIFGQLLDQGYPRAIFFCVAACALISIATVAINTSRKAAAA